MTPKFKVLKNKQTPRISKRSRYPWHLVKKDQPILLKDRRIQHVSSTAYAAARRLGVVFTLRSVEGGVEVHLA